MDVCAAAPADGHARACGEPRPCIQCGTVVQQEESLPAGVSSPHKYCYNCGGPLLQCVVPKFCHECGARVNIGP
jgi:rRNA maturation endonuclease Nob1